MAPGGRPPAWRRQPLAGLNPSSPLARLIAAPARPGVVRWIGLRPARRAAPQPVEAATLDPDGGLAGDHYSSRTSRSRQVTLIGAEHLVAIAAYLCRDAIEPGLLRRNIVTSGVNLVALAHARFRLGGAVLEGTGLCQPCSRMEEVLGVGGYNAVRGHGGITARIIEGGTVSLLDALIRVEGSL